MAPLHSLILAYRNRAQSLRVLLEYFERCRDTEQVEFILVDLNSTDTVQLDAYELNIQHHAIPYSGTFWKTKALNYGLLQSQGQIVTIHDVDCLPAPDFFEQIHDYFEDPDNHNRKLARDVVLLDRKATEGIRHIRPWEIDTSGFAKSATQFNEKIIGNSQCSMLRENFDKLGGYDEGYIGYGYEDYEFSLRCHNHYGNAVILGTLWHMWHERESDWQNHDAMRLTTERFKSADRNGFPDLAHQPAYGKFQ